MFKLLFEICVCFIVLDFCGDLVCVERVVILGFDVFVYNIEIVEEF